MNWGRLYVFKITLLFQLLAFSVFFFARTGKLHISEMRSRPGSWHA